MGRPSLITIRAALAATAFTTGTVTGLLHSLPAQALPETCPGAATGTVEVTVGEPGAGTAVSGPVSVTGNVQAGSDVFRVELFVGDSLRDSVTVEPPSRSVDYDLQWDATATPAGPRVLTVVACGGLPQQGQLVKGAARTEVEVKAVSEAGSRSRSLGVAPARDEKQRSRLGIGLAIAAAGVAGLAYGLGAASFRRQSTPPAADGQEAG